MGNSSSKNKASSKASSIRSASGRGGDSTPTIPAPPQRSPQDRLAAQLYSNRIPPRGSRPDLPFLTLVRDRQDAPPSQPERPRETKQEREARKVERERKARLMERERSLQEEHVDGGYLVTLGTYTGPEDFSKTIVRQLQIERRLAPFWRGLNDFSSSWTEAQLVAAARALPIPAPDEIPADMARTGSQVSIDPRPSDINMDSLTVPITSRSQSHDSSTSAQISPSHSAFSSSGPSSPTYPSSSTAQLFRGRAKTLASLASGTKSHSPDLTPQEMQLPKDSCVHGQPIEAYLYKDASECPICFMYYPPYLNKTRCCDQPICSECFVQIKRPDPHPPEHEQPGQQRPPEEEAELLVSEVASCPFCVTPEFGVSYEPPPFRRGLAYSKQSSGNPLTNPTSAMSSTSSLGNSGRRRTLSLSANAPQVITTDRVRPDWAGKLADARAHALRRSAAATALHNAAYVLGSQGDSQFRTLAAFTRRRRSLFDTPGASGSGSPRNAEGILLSPYAHITRMGALGVRREGEEEGNDDLFPARGSSRRQPRMEDLEDLMMMEAIRLSLAAEEERKRKEDKDSKKDAKKKAKEEKKEAKQAEKLAKKGGSGGGMLYQAGPNDSETTWASTSMARSDSNLGVQPGVSEEQTQGKGKAPAQDFAGFIPLLEPTSTLNTEFKQKDDTPPPARDASRSISEDAQRHLEESRANLQPTTSTPIPIPTLPSTHMRQLSNASSMASSFNDSSLPAESNIPSATGSGLDVPSTAHSGTPPAEPMLNFRSLAAMIGDEDDKAAPESEHIEHGSELKEPSPTGSPRLSAVEGNRSRGDSGESSGSAPPPVYCEDGDGDQITPAPARAAVERVGVVRDVDSKELGSWDVLGHNGRGYHQATQ